MGETHIYLNPATFTFLVFYHAVKNSSNIFLLEQSIGCIDCFLRLGPGNEFSGSEYVNLFHTIDI